MEVLLNDSMPPVLEQKSDHIRLHVLDLTNLQFLYFSLILNINVLHEFALEFAQDFGIKALISSRRQI